MPVLHSWDVLKMPKSENIREDFNLTLEELGEYKDNMSLA